MVKVAMDLSPISESGPMNVGNAVIAVNFALRAAPGPASRPRQIDRPTPLLTPPRRLTINWPLVEPKGAPVGANLLVKLAPEKGRV